MAHILQSAKLVVMHSPSSIRLSITSSGPVIVPFLNPMKVPYAFFCVRKDWSFALHFSLAILINLLIMPLRSFRLVSGIESLAPKKWQEPKGPVKACYVTEKCPLHLRKTSAGLVYFFFVFGKFAVMTKLMFSKFIIRAIKITEF